jgi:hypothetical protein
MEKWMPIKKLEPPVPETNLLDLDIAPQKATEAVGVATAAMKPGCKSSSQWPCNLLVWPHGAVVQPVPVVAWLVGVMVVAVAGMQM